LVLILNCTNTTSKKKLFRNVLYYLINFFCLRNKLTKNIAYKHQSIETISFESTYDNSWQIIPDLIYNKVNKKKIDIVIKFGMSLLKVSKKSEGLNILSFHHGDPEYYRGRPAGFYELMNFEEKIGIVVQKISNKIDGGIVYARCFSKIFHHSYKKTAINYFSLSEHLLKKAILNLTKQKTITLNKLGRNYSLPSNSLCLFFLFVILKRSISKIVYGLFFEKSWNICVCKFKNLNSLKNLSSKNGKIPNIPLKYSFFADPFLSFDRQKIRAEALNAWSGKGEIVELSLADLHFRKILLKNFHHHYSYPISFYFRNVEYILPEVANHSAPFAQEIGSKGRKIMLKGLENKKLLDSTLLKYKNNFYIFSSVVGSESDCLNLFVSKSPFGPYSDHPDNPIVIDPTCSRMGGEFFKKGRALYRFGQNNGFGYGEKIQIYKIETLSPHSYLESKFDEISFKDAYGPHTATIHNNQIILDFYRNKFSLFAWRRRLSASI